MNRKNLGSLKKKKTKTKINSIISNSSIPKYFFHKLSYQLQMCAIPIHPIRSTMECSKGGLIHFAPIFCKMVTSILQLDLMNLFVKARAWFNPITQGMAILIANTSSTFHRDERLGNTHAMHGKCNYEIEMPEETSFLS